MMIMMMSSIIVMIISAFFWLRAEKKAKEQEIEIRKLNLVRMGFESLVADMSINYGLLKTRLAMCEQELEDEQIVHQMVEDAKSKKKGAKK